MQELWMDTACSNILSILNPQMTPMGIVTNRLLIVWFKPTIYFALILLLSHNIPYVRVLHTDDLFKSRRAHTTKSFTDGQC